MTREPCHSSTQAERCDNENTAIVTNQQVLKLWKEYEQLCCHPIHNWDVPRESEKERTNEKRWWKTVQRTEHDQMSNCCRFFLNFLYFFSPFEKNIFATLHLWWLFVSTPSLSPFYRADNPNVCKKKKKKIINLLVFILFRVCF